MATVIFYNFILFSSTFFVWLSEKGKRNSDRIFLLSIAFLIVFLPSALRYDIGTDYENYLAIYVAPERLYYYLKEPLFYFVNWILQQLDAHFQWMFATFAFIFTAVVFKAYPKKNAWLLHFVFFSMIWFFSFNVMRQAVALAWCLLAIINFFDKRYLWFIILSIIGSMFHQSVLLITAVGLLALVPLNIHLKIKVAPLVFIGFILFTFVSMSIVLVYIEQILNLVGLTKYANYFHNTKHFIEKDFGTGLGILAMLLFSIYIILNTKYFLRENKNYWILIILIFIYTIGLILANHIVIFERMSGTFVLAPILGAYILSQLQTRKTIHQIVLVLFLLFLVLSFTKDGMGIETSYGNSKRNPYKSILTE